MADERPKDELEKKDERAPDGAEGTRDVPEARGADGGDAATPDHRPGGDYERLLEAARRMGFRNPDLAARYAGFEEEPERALEELAREEPSLLAPKVGPSNPAVSRGPESLAERLRRAMRARRSRPFRS